VIAILSSPTLLPGDLAWSAQTVAAAAGLLAALGNAEGVRQADDVAVEIRGLSQEAMRDAVLGRLRELHAAVAPLAVVTDQPVALGVVAEIVGGEVGRIAGLRGVRVAVDLVCPVGIEIAPKAAGLLIDVLGQVARDGATSGTRDGGAIRIVFASDDDGLVVVVSDRGDVGAGQLPAVREDDPDRSLALQVAQGRLAAEGGELSLASGAWGGTSVTVRLPRDEAPTRGR
jgi:hypothetical protein